MSAYLVGGGTDGRLSALLAYTTHAVALDACDCDGQFVTTWMHTIYDVMGDHCLFSRWRRRRALVRLRRSRRKGQPRVPHLDVEGFGVAWVGANAHVHTQQRRCG